MTKIAGLIAISILIIIYIAILWLWFSTYYVIKENDLLIRCGPFKKMIKLESISSIKKTTMALSAPALSLKRIEIMYDQYNMIYISPEDRDHFISLLLKKCKNPDLKS